MEILNYEIKILMTKSRAINLLSRLDLSEAVNQ